jgi:hypothetical protein
MACSYVIYSISILIKAWKAPGEQAAMLCAVKKHPSTPGGGIVPSPCASRQIEASHAAG